MLFKKGLISHFTILVSMMAFLTSAAAETDKDGYPIFYICGYDFGNWNAKPENKMQRDGDIYSIHVPVLSSEFKFTNDDWSINFGAAGKSTVEKPIILEGLNNAPNFKAPEPLNDVKVSFRYDLNNTRTTKIFFSVAGVEPVYEIEGLSGTLPVLYINVYDEKGNYNNEIIDKNLAHKNYFSGEYWLDLNGCDWMEAEGAESVGSAKEPLPLEIKARGNWTRKGFAKKPFKLKLGKKQKLLGLSKSKHFAILAHADDSFGYLKNFTGFNLGRRIGLPWTPSQQPVEVVINGDYRGLYFLTESIRVESDRIDIAELKDGETDLSLLSGGYLIELDNYDEPNDSQIQMQEKGSYPGFKDMLRITFDTPEVYSEYQRMFITEQFSKMNNLIGECSDDLWSYIDMDDLARYYLICEIMSHVEAFHGSTYMFRDRGENQKWHFSPLWDFGNGFAGPTDGYIYDHAPYGMTWIGSINYNTKFKDKLKSTWKWFLSNKFDGIYDDMKEICDHLEEAAKADHLRWKDKPVPDGGMPVADNSNLSQKLKDARSHLENKVTWLISQFGDYKDMIYSEPERDDTEAAPLPEFISVGISSALTDNEDMNSVYYNLQGVPVSTPQTGNIYIVRDKNGTRKIHVK